MLDTDPALLDLPVAPVVAAASDFHYCPSLTQTPPCWTCLPHPSWLQLLTFNITPCLTQTLLCWTCLLHLLRLNL